MIFTDSLSRFGGIVCCMKKSAISKYLSELGRKGGKARLKTMTAEQRREIAMKASRAAAQKRTAAAKAKKRRNQETP